MSHSYKPYLCQNYDLIRKTCRIRNELFIDDMFPAHDSSIYLSGKNDDRDIIWKRPRDFLSRPGFMLNHGDMSNLTQGNLGNWYVLYKS